MRSPYQASPSISLHHQAFHIWPPVYLLILNHQTVNPIDPKAIRQINYKKLIYQKGRQKYHRNSIFGSTDQNLVVIDRMTEIDLFFFFDRCDPSQPLIVIQKIHKRLDSDVTK